jgi:6-phosphofructokinase
MPEEKSFHTADPKILSLLKRVMPFSELTEVELTSVAQILKKYEYSDGETVIREGDTGSTAYIVSGGIFDLDIMGQQVRKFEAGDFFGEIALIDARPRMGTVTSSGVSSLFLIEGSDLENKDLINPEITMKIYRGFSRLITSYLREGSNLYKEMEVLLVQDGGCAPGYNPVTAFISEDLEKSGFKVYICAEGFCSLVSDKPLGYRRLVYDTKEYHRLEHLPGVIFSPPLRESRGADFRSERFPEFQQKKIQKVAAKNVISKNVMVLIGIGGNGTFTGIKSLSQYLPDTIRTFFIPVTIDSDIYGTDCIGEFTGVEIGSEKIRCYMADSRTHKRIYIIEMMGAHGGYHALHSCLGAGAHLAVLPNAKYDLKSIGNALTYRESAVIVVAEGYKSKQRSEEEFTGNAAEFFYKELLDSGFKPKNRVICEPFSRDIRGSKPNNLDLMLAQRMARKLTELVVSDGRQAMPAVLSGKEYSIGFDDIRTDNSVESDLASLANRLIPDFTTQMRE